MKTTHKGKIRFRCDWYKKLIPINDYYSTTFTNYGDFCNMSHANKKYKELFQLPLNVEQVTGDVIPVKNPGGNS